MERKEFTSFMDLDKVYDNVDGEVMWAVLKVSGVDGKLLNRVKAFYRDANSCVKLKDGCEINNYIEM